MKTISVFGSARPKPGSKDYADAEKVGALLAQAGYAVATGGYMGLTKGPRADMRVVDIYRRDGDKLAENWVFIDLLHWLSEQGLDVLQRMRQQLGLERFGGDV